MSLHRRAQPGRSKCTNTLFLHYKHPLKADVPQLEAIISKPWGKEDELKQLKFDLAALDRKITAALAPTHEVPDDRMGVKKEELDGEEVKCDDQYQQMEAPAQSAGSKESMVAEPNMDYKSKCSRIGL